MNDSNNSNDLLDLFYFTILLLVVVFILESFF